MKVFSMKPVPQMQKSKGRHLPSLYSGRFDIQDNLIVV